MSASGPSGPLVVKVRYFHSLKGWVTGPTALESDGPYFGIMGQ